MKIHLKNMHIAVSLGVYEWEKHGARDVVVQLEIDYDSGQSFASDAIEDTLDYAMLERRVIDVAQAKHYNLVETLVVAIGKAALAMPRVREVTVEVEKPGALKHAQGITIRETFKP